MKFTNPIPKSERGKLNKLINKLKEKNVITDADVKQIKGEK